MCSLVITLRQQRSEAEEIVAAFSDEGEVRVRVRVRVWVWVRVRAKRRR